MKKIIEQEVIRLVKKHNTNNPFEIADAENILVLQEPLGTINGYYNKYVRQKIIHINISLSHLKKILTCAHELGHTIFHPNANTPFLRDKTFLSINKLEREANLFCAILLVPKDILLDYQGFTLQQIAQAERIPIELLKLRFELI